MSEKICTGLLGEKLSHSLSPQIHKLITGNDYALFEKTPEEVEDFVKNSTLAGYNITVPYKKAVIPFLTKLSGEAALTGAVNTVTNRNGERTGYNTDVFGFTALLQKTGTDISGKRAVILGSGGVAAAVRTALKKLNAGEIITVSRSGETNYSNVYSIKTAELLVNTTPLGMFPNTDLSPLELKNFEKINTVIDLIYNPLRTPLLIEAEELGIKAYNGLYMLVSQAVKSFELFYYTVYPEETADTVYKKLLSGFENTVLIGMPSCGKTSTGKKIAEKTGKIFIDTDREITKRTGLSPEEIIKKQGENYFREIEKDIIKSVANTSGAVIATGGGAVTREENIFELKKNSRIIFIDRDISDLSAENRPLSQSTGIKKLFEERYGLYKKYSDITVKAGKNSEETADKILSVLRGE